MARISMRNVQKSSVSEYYDLYLSSAAARGVKDKTLQTYKNHFRSIAKRMDVTVPMNRLNSQHLEDMILSMREEGLSASSINSYTRTLKVFFSWCNEEGHSSLNQSPLWIQVSSDFIVSPPSALFILRCSFCYKYKNICLLLYTGFLYLSSTNSACLIRELIFNLVAIIFHGNSPSISQLPHECKSRVSFFTTVLLSKINIAYSALCVHSFAITPQKMSGSVIRCRTKS